MGTADARRLLLVAAEPRELRGILRRCAAVRSLRWPIWFARSGKLNGNELIMVANGPGPELAAEAARAALERSRPDAVISTGYCAALDPAFAAGEVFVALRVEAAGTTYAGSVPRTDGRFFRTGTLASADRVIGSVAEKARLHASGAAAAEMEAGAVALEACRNGLPFFCIRTILDRASEGFELDFNSLRGADGRFSRAGIVKTALKRPLAGVPELLRLERRGRIASRALGDFIGNCRF
jgi:nucleoside phosphorylase